MNSEILDRLPPHDQPAEAGVIGSVLIDPDRFDDVTAIVGAADFYTDEHRVIFETIIAMEDAGVPIDATVLLSRLKDRDGDTQWTSVLADIACKTPSAANAKHYAKIVRTKAEYRAIIETAARTLQAAYGEEDKPSEIASYGESMLNAAIDGNMSHAVVTIADAAAAALATAKERADGSRPGGLETGLSDYDRSTGGFYPGELIILAARPGMGKSAMGMQIATNIATRGRRVLFVSLEMSAPELAARALCARGEVNGTSFRTGKLLPADLADLDKAATELAAADLLILDAPTVSLADVRRTARQVQAHHGMALVVIDYLQFLTAENPRDPRQEQVAKMARGLKTLARELGIPVLCLAQLNRQAANSKDGGRPRLSHLRESGAIEQDSDVVLALHREEVSRPNDDDVKGKADLLTLKNRNGPARDYELHFDGPTQTFTTRSLEWDPSAEF